MDKPHHTWPWRHSNASAGENGQVPVLKQEKKMPTFFSRKAKNLREGWGTQISGASCSAAVLALDVALGVAYLHSKKVIHMVRSRFVPSPREPWILKIHSYSRLFSLARPPSCRS